MPADYEKSLARHVAVRHGVGRGQGREGLAADQLHHLSLGACARSSSCPTASSAQFEKTGRIDWVTDLAEIPAKFGVKNVYGELGTCFANTCVTHPQLAAALIGTLIKGLGEDKVIWGTDSVWYGSPQWQIEAMRRLEIPEDMQKKHGFKPLGAADGPVKTKIFAGNAAKLYKIDPAAAQKTVGRQLRCDQGRIPGDGRPAEQPALRVRAPELAPYREQHRVVDGVDRAVGADRRWACTTGRGRC